MKIMLIGGGETGRGNTTYETKEIDCEVVKMTEKEHPNFLFVGLASSFSDSYYDTMKKIYKDLGCECAYLKKKNILNNRDIVENKIRSADIIYFCGGDTIKLVNDLKEYHLVELIKETVSKNTVLVGMSAGGIMLANEGYSDSLKIRGESDKYDFVEGLGIVPITFSPHHTEDKVKELKEEIGNRVVYSLENNTALKIIDKTYKVIKSLETAKAYMIQDNTEKEIDSGNI